MPVRIMTVLGTRPEAIKLAPVVKAFLGDAEIEHTLCATGQHRQMLDQVLEVFRLTPDYDINLMKPGQDLTHVTATALAGVGQVIDTVKPDWVVVQGDTTTAFAAALAAFYRKVKVAHVEAGLRSGNLYSPWPEEANRKLVSAIATMHFPPTEESRQNLLRENVADDAIVVTGNTVIDALLWMNATLSSEPALRQQAEAKFSFLDPTKKLILVTGHRRENFDGGLEHVCTALAQLAARPDIEIVYPVHLNPKVQETAKRILSGRPNVHLIEPLEYAPFVALMRRSTIIVTDSGGIQEEAPSLDIPVLVTRDTTERPEAVASGAARLVGTSADAIISCVAELLDNRSVYEAMAKAPNPFGDGSASKLIGSALKAWRGR